MAARRIENQHLAVRPGRFLTRPRHAGPGGVPGALRGRWEGVWPDSTGRITSESIIASLSPSYPSRPRRLRRRKHAHAMHRASTKGREGKGTGRGRERKGPRPPLLKNASIPFQHAFGGGIGKDLVLFPHAAEESFAGRRRERQGRGVPRTPAALGFEPGELLRPVEDGGRDRGEHFWQFKERLMQKQSVTALNYETAWQRVQHIKAARFRHA